MTHELPPRGALVPHWIDGARTTGTSTRRGDVFQPATGDVARQVVLADKADVDLAVAAAAKAAQSWADSTLSARSRILFAFRELLDAHRDELAEIITAEHGKVLSDAAGEVARGLEVVPGGAGRPATRAARPPRPLALGSCRRPTARRAGGPVRRRKSRQAPSRLWTPHH